MKTLFVILACVALLAMAPASGHAAVAAFPCTCNLDYNQFPATCSDGDLTESLACDPQASACTVTGNITWTPAVNGFGCGGSGWDEMKSYSTSTSGGSCNPSPGTYSYFSNCTGATSNPHTCSWSCGQGTGYGGTFEGKIYNNAGAAVLIAAKRFYCQTQ